MKSQLVTALELLTLSALCASASAQQISDQQRAAIKSACRGDYMNVCANVPTGTKESLQCLQQHSQDVSAGCRTAVAAVTPSAASASAAATAAPSSAAVAAATTAAPPAPAASALSPREEMHVVRSDCGGDFQKFCPEVRMGGGRAAACLRAHGADLTPACRSALGSVAPK